MEFVKIYAVINWILSRCYGIRNSACKIIQLYVAKILRVLAHTFEKTRKSSTQYYHAHKRVYKMIQPDVGGNLKKL